MNEKLIKVGKTTLATVMATSMSFSVVSALPILAEETETPVEQTEPVEKTDPTTETTPVTTPTEETPNEEVPVETSKTTPTQDVVGPEQPLGTAPMVQAPQPTVAVPVQDDSSESSLKQSTNFAPGYSDANTVDELKAKLDGLIKQAEAIWEEKGGYDYFKNNVSINQAIEKTIPKAKEYLAEGKSTVKTFSWRCYEMESVIKAFNNQSNVLSEDAKTIYALNEEMLNTDSTQFTKSSWDAYEKAVETAMTKANGNVSDLKEYIEAVETAKTNLQKVDENLKELNALIVECEAIVEAQRNEDTRKNYSMNSYSVFTTRLEEARTEVRKENQSIDEAVFNALYNNLFNAKESLEVVTDFHQNEVGIRDSWTAQSNIGDGWLNYQTTRVRGGKLFVSSERDNKDGTSTIEVTFINDGTDPVTGGYFHNYMSPTSPHKEEWGLRKYEKHMLRDQLDLKVVVTDSEGKTKTQELEDLGEKVLNGFTAEFKVPQNAAVDLDITQWNSGGYVTHSLGTYYTMVPDTTAPVINAKDVTLTVGDKFEALKGVTAIDGVDGDLTRFIKVSGDKVDTNKAGTYKVTYTVTDAAGNEATKTITVTVKEKASTEKPEEGKPGTSDKEDPKKEDGTQTSVSLSTGLFAGLTGISAAGLGVLEVLKRRKK